MEKEKLYDTVIIGSGPAGMSAAVYARRARLDMCLVDANFFGGGQVINTYEVDNYPGLPGISGMELAGKMEEHVKRLGAELRQCTVSSIVIDGTCRRVVTDQGELPAKTVILATGAVHRLLDVPGEKEFTGKGVSYCATCDGAFFRDRTVCVVGGGDVALEDAVFLARACRKVYLIHRRDALRGAAVLRETVKGLDNVEILWDTVVTAIHGTDGVESVSLHHNKTGEDRQLPTDGVFVAVGIRPNSEPFRSLAECDEAGYIKADETCVTSCPGIFAAGDVRTKPLRQIVTAAADGANAVASVEKYLLTFS